MVNKGQIMITCSGSECSNFSNWNFNGANGMNTDNGKVYVLLQTIIGTIEGSEEPPQTLQTLSIYKDVAISEQVATGIRAAALGAGSIAITVVNDSGLTGSVTWNGTQVPGSNVTLSGLVEIVDPKPGERVALIVKIGDQPTASGKEYLGMKEGMPICYIDEKDWKLPLEEILSPDMHRIFACIQVDKSKLPFIDEMLEPLKDNSTIRQRKKYIKLKTLESETGIVDLESKLRHRATKVPLINGMGLSDDLWEGAQGTPEGIEQFDFNQITAGAATIGVLGTYATWALGFADLGNLTGNLTFTQISNAIEVGRTITTENLAGNTFRNTSNYPHNGDPTRGWRLDINSAATSPIFCEMEGPGTYIIENLRMTAVLAGNNAAFVFYRNIAAAFDFHLCDCLFDCAALFDQGIKLNDTTPILYMYNNVIWDSANAGGTGAAFLLQANLAGASRVENNAVYGGARTGWDLANNAAVLSNNYALAGANAYTQIGAATGTNNLGDTAQNADVNWAVGVGNIINTAAVNCVRSVVDTNPLFLDILSGGALDGAGVANAAALARTVGIRNRPVPGPNGTSIGPAEFQYYPIVGQSRIHIPVGIGI